MDIKDIVKNIRNISIIIAGIPAVSALALHFNMITVRQLLVIDATCVAIMAILVIFAIFQLRKAIKISGAPALYNFKVVIPKANVGNKFIIANSDVFKKNIVPTNPLRRCVFRISMEINSSIEKLGISAVRLRNSGIVENTIIKNIVAKEVYVIDTVVLPDETINLKFDKDIDIKKMLIDELYIP